ncbi:MAG: fumarylacetoacetate hydrolase family protein [Promethearchaeota archaeon]
MILLSIIDQNGETYELHPKKIICLGRNYRAHAKELGSDVPSEPIFFVKTPTCLIGNEDDIILPSEELGIKRVDHEIELAVIIGKRCKNVNEGDALGCVLGYTVFNDITARDLQKKDIERSLPWFRSKNLDTFGAIGPSLLIADGVDPQDLELILKVNGVVRQKASTKDMIFPVKKLISFISRYMTLEEGDIIATGTPKGVGPIKDGDLLEATIEPIGTLVNNVKKT